MSKTIKIRDISVKGKQFVEIDKHRLPNLPYPYEDWVEPDIPQIPDEKRARLDVSLDGILNPAIPIPETEDQKEKLVAQFLEGLKNLLSKENNWTFLKPLMLSLDNCVKCNTCSDACPIFMESGQIEAYRPLFRSDVLRRIINKHIKPGGKLTAKFTGADIDLNWVELYLFLLPTKLSQVIKLFLRV